jgi:glycosyltransferase involved in cell wall biosynthesis
MKILFVVPYAPNLVRVRPYQLILALARRGHRVTLVTAWTSEGERASLERLAAGGIHVVADRLCPQRTLWNVLRALPSRAPLQASFCWQPTVARGLLSALRDWGPDIVHVEHLRGARYGLRVLEVLEADGRDGGPAVIWDSVDCISHLFAQAARDSRSLKGRLMARLELQRTRHYEGWLVSRFDRVLVTSEVDRRALLGLSRHPRPITVLPNGVDLEYFSPVDEVREPSTLVITGKMSYHANVTAALHLAQDIMPLIWARRPDVRLSIVGKDPAREIRALEARAEQWPASNGSRSTDGSSTARAGARVQVVGSVADMRPHLRRATIAVAPVLYGAGIQNKVLEAMASGAPVVASPQATSALAARPGRDLLVAHTPHEFADAVLALLEAPTRRVELGHAGRAYVESHHDWMAVAAQLEQIYRDADAAVSRDEMQSAASAAPGGPRPGVEWFA